MTKVIMHGCNGKMGQMITGIIAEDKDVERAKSIISKYSQTRTHTASSTATFGTNMSELDKAKEITVGGATVFVLSVDSMDKY